MKSTMEERKAKNYIKHSFANSMSVSIFWSLVWGRREEETEVSVPGQAEGVCPLSREALDLSSEQHSDSWVRLHRRYSVLGDFLFNIP